MMFWCTGTVALNELAFQIDLFWLIDALAFSLSVHSEVSSELSIELILLNILQKKLVLEFV